MTPTQSDIIKILTDCFHMKGAQISEISEKHDLFLDQALISRIKTGKKYFPIDSDICYKIFFEQLPKSQNINKEDALLSILTYLRKYNMMTPELEKHVNKGYEDFVRMLLKLAFIRDNKNAMKVTKVETTVASIGKDRRSYLVVDEKTVREWGWTPEYQVKQCMELDYETIDHITPEHEGDIAQWVSIIREHGQTWRILVDDNQQIIGYWHFVPLFDEDYELMKEGDLPDGNIRLDQIPRMLPGEYNIYFISICLKVLYQKEMAILRLLESIVDVVDELASQDIYLKNVCTLAYTASGKALCKQLGLKLHKHLAHGDIYTHDMLDLLNSPIFRKNAKSAKIAKTYTSYFANEIPG